MKLFYFIFLLSLYSATIQAQNTFLMESYLSAPFNNQTVDAYQSQLDFLEDNNYNFPWVHRVELRVGNEGVVNKPNQYRVRFSPSNPAEIKANKSYYNKQVNTIQSRQKIAFSDALFNRYLLIIDFASLLDMKSIINERIKYQTNLTANANNGTSEINLKTIISMHNDQSKLLLNLEEIETKLLKTRHFIRLDYESIPLKVDSIFNLIQVNQIKTFMDVLVESSNQQNTRVQVLKDEFELEEQKLSIERAEARSNLGYIQSNLDNDKKGDFTDQLGFQVGLRLPIVNPDKSKINRLKVELIEEKAETDSKVSLLEQTLLLNKQLLKRQIIRHKLIVERIKSSSEIPVTGSNQLDWDQVITLKNYQLSLLKEKIESERMIRQSFITILNAEGKLVEGPIKNYLSSTFKLITN